MSFKELLNDYLTDCKVNDKKNLARAERCVKFLKDEFGNMKAIEVNTAAIKNQERNHKRSRKQKMKCSYVFHLDWKEILDFRKSWRTACTKIGQPDLLFHDMRRSAIRNGEGQAYLNVSLWPFRATRPAASLTITTSFLRMI